MGTSKFWGIQIQIIVIAKSEAIRRHIIVIAKSAETSEAVQNFVKSQIHSYSQIRGHPLP